MPLELTSTSSPSIPFHTFCLDVLHWVTHLHPRASAHRWPVGKVSASITVDRIVRTGAKSRGRKRSASTNVSLGPLPPSVRRRLNDVITATESSTWMAKLPCVRTEEDAASLAPLWASVLANVSQPARCEPVPVSLATHEDRMLQYGRDVPKCALGEDACAACQYPGNQGPLPIYVMPAVQALLDSGRKQPHPFPSDAACLLCIRRDVHAACLAWNSMISNPSMQINRGACVPPPFCNLVDVPGGYVAEAMVTTKSNKEHHQDLSECFGHFAIHCAAARSTARETALERMCQVHRAVSALPFEPGVVANASLYIQSHVPASTFTGTVHELYVACKHPDVCHQDALVCHLLNRNHSVVCKAWHSQHHDDNIDVLAKLVRKGGPAPSSVRYVAGLMRRCANTAEGEQAIRDMLCSHYLGGYRHSTRCADPAQHMSFLSMSTKQMLDYAMSASTTRQLHTIVSEYVCANTLTNQALLASVGPQASRHAQGVAAGTLRAFGRSTPPTATPSFSCVMTLSKALNVNNNSTNTPLLSDAEAELARSMTGIISPYTLLKQSGIATAAELEMVARCTDKNRHNTLKAMRMVLKATSKKTRQFMALAIHAAMRRARLVVQTLSHEVKTAQLASLARHNRACAGVLAYCQECCTFRAHVLGAKMPRTRCGVSINMLTDEVHCNNCESSTGIVHIDLPGRVVTVLGRHLERHKRLGPITICCRCSQPTVFDHVFGMYPLCAPCLELSKRELHRPKMCHLCDMQCGVGSTWCEVIEAGGGADMVWFCKVHANLAPDRPVRMQDLLAEVGGR